jgi:hypothetical protein
MIRVVHPDFLVFTHPETGVKKAPDPGSGSAKLFVWIWNLESGSQSYRSGSFSLLAGKDGPVAFNDVNKLKLSLLQIFLLQS